MDQAAKLKLVALATTQVKWRFVAIMDFASAQVEGQQFMAMAAESLGLSAREGRKTYDKAFPEFRKSLEASAEQQARDEVYRAIEEAEAEQEHHTVLLADFRRDHEALLQSLAGHHQKRVRELKEAEDGDFIQLANDSHKSWVAIAERSHESLMALVQEKHCLNLWHAFSKHLVPEGTVLLQLIDLYEVK